MNYDKNLKENHSLHNGMNEKSFNNQEYEIIALKRNNYDRIRAGMFWYSDDTISDKLIADKVLKSIVLYVTQDWVVGDSFEQKKLSWPEAMNYVEIFTNNFIAKGCAYKVPFDELLYIYDNIKVINNALTMLGKDLWDKNYWTATFYSVSELQRFNKPVAWGVFLKKNRFLQIDLNEKLYVRPLIRFKL